MFFLLSLLCILGGSLGKKLPEYISRCSLSDPNFVKCAIEIGNNAISILVKGDEAYGIPVLSPLLIPEMKFNAENFELTLTDVYFDNFKDFKLVDGGADHKNHRRYIVFKIPELHFKSNYQITNGKLFGRLVTGSGNFAMTLRDNDMKYLATFKRVERNGESHAITKNPEVFLTTDHGSFYFEGLKFTDEGPDTDVSELILSDWEVVWRLMKFDLEKFILKHVQEVIDNIDERVPIKEIFLP